MNSAGYLHLTTGDGGNQAISTANGSVTTGEWHHVAGVIDRTSGVMKIYLDGKEILMISEKRFTLQNLAPGPHTVKVVLSGTNHFNLLHEGKPIADSREIVVKP